MWYNNIPVHKDKTHKGFISSKCARLIMQSVISTLKWSSNLCWQCYFNNSSHIWQSPAVKYLKITDGDNFRNIVVNDQTELSDIHIVLLIYNISNQGGYYCCCYWNIIWLVTSVLFVWSLRPSTKSTIKINFMQILKSVLCIVSSNSIGEYLRGPIMSRVNNCLPNCNR